jgi:hypothetical protein
MHIRCEGRAAIAALVLATFGARAEGEREIRATAGAAAAVKQSFHHAKPIAGATPEQRSTTLRPLGVAPPSSGAVDGASGKPRYPGDLQYHGGAVLTSTVHHAIFVNPTPACPANSCWGDPIGFLRDLNKSNFIHVTDQYVGTSANHRYPVGANYVINYPVGLQPLTDLDIEIIAFAAAQFSGNTGYGHMYHVFLKPGQDLCFDSSDTICYSPDNFPTFFFCAYHGSFDSSIGHVVYSAEPFQDVVGCSARPDSPNGQLVDSTNNVLSHEAIEAITDPDGDAYWNSLDNGLYGQEIGDECSFLKFTATNVYFDPSNIRLNGKLYAIQPEYSNIGHVCETRRPGDD